MDQKGTLIYEHELGARISHDTLVFGKEFRGEKLGTSDLMEAFYRTTIAIWWSRSTAVCRRSAWILFIAT